MNYVVAVLLYHETEAQSYAIFQGMLRERQLRYMYVAGFPLLGHHLHILDKQIRKHLPSLHRQFRKLAVSSEMFATDWFMTLFSRTFEGRMNMISAIWDWFACDGWCVLHRVSLAMLKMAQDVLLNAGDFETIMQHFPKIGTFFGKPEMLLATANTFPVSEDIVEFDPSEVKHRN